MRQEEEVRRYRAWTTEPVQSSLPPDIRPAYQM
jgi:hypothetical protein